MPSYSWEKNPPISGEVTKVIDGDTVVIKTPKGESKHVRLSNTDAPEYVQEGGDKAKQALEKRLPIGKTVTVNNTKEDQYGRTVGNVYHNGSDVGSDMIKAGEVNAYGQKASLLDRVMGKKDPASFRHGTKGNYSWEKEGVSNKKPYSWEPGGEKAEPKDSSLWDTAKAGIKSFAEGIPGAAGGVAGAEAAISVGSPLIAASGPYAPLTTLGLAAAGGVVGAIGASKASEYAMDQVPKDIRKDIGFGEKQREKERAQHPTASFVGDLASSAPFFRPGKSSKMEAALGAVMGGAFETGSQLASGEDMNLGHIAMATGWGGVASKPTKITQSVSKKFGNEASKYSWEKGDSEGKGDPTREKHIDGLMGKFKAEADADVVEKQKVKDTFNKQKEEFDKKKAEPVPEQKWKLPDDAPFTMEQINKSFESKPWTNPKGEGIKPLPEDAFKTPEEYAQFLLEYKGHKDSLSYDKWKEQKYKEAADKRQASIQEDLPAKGKVPEEDKLPGDTFNEGWEVANAKIKQSLHKMTDEGLDNFIRVQSMRLFGSADGKQVTGILANTIQSEIQYAKHLVEKRNRVKSPEQYEPITGELKTQEQIKKESEEKVNNRKKEVDAEIKKLVDEAGGDSKGAYQQENIDKALKSTKEKFAPKETKQQPLTEPVEGKTKLDRQKEYWERQKNFVGPKKPYEPKQDKFKSVRQDPPEDNMPRTETKTLDLHAESKFNEQEARRLYHTEGPEAAKAHLEETSKHTPEVIRQLEDAIGININHNVAISREAAIFKSKIEKLLPDEQARRELPSKIEQGLPLTKEEQAVLDLHKSKMEEIGQKAMSTGVIKGTMENYVARRATASNVAEKDLPSFIEKILSASFTGPDLKKSSKSGLERFYETLQETEKALAAQGIELERDIAKIDHGYMLDMLQAIEGKKLWTKLQETNIGDFKAAMPPTIKPSMVPKQYEYITHGAYKGWAVHPDIKPALNFVLGAREPGVFLKGALAFNNAVKRSNIAASFFHAKSLIEAAALARSYMGTGDISLRKVLEMYHNGGAGDSADQWLKAGVIASGGNIDVSQSVLASIGATADKLSGKFGNKHYAERGLTWFEKNTLGKIDHITWDILHDGLKLMVAEHKLQQALRDHPNIAESTHRQEIARFVNNSFGGLNWYDIARQSNTEFTKRLSMAAYNPEGRRMLQAVLFAPDWTVSTLRSFTTALPKQLFDPGSWDIKGGAQGLIKPKTQGDYARQYQMKFALMYLTALNGINMMTSGHPIWDNKDKTRIEFEDGTTMQATKHAMEWVHALSDIDQFTSNKLGFIPKAAITTLAGVEYAGPTAPKLEDNTIQGRINAIAKTMLPFSVGSIMNAPKGEEVKRALSSTLGFPIYGETKAQKAEKRVEKRQKALNNRIKDWKAKGLMGDEE